MAVSNTDPLQMRVYDAVLAQRKNVFVTGKAGTGKSTIIREIISQMTSRNIIIAVTASTGIAARNLNGSTFHKFLGCGMALEPAQKLLEKLVRYRRRGADALKRWKSVEVLIIDEISMIDADLLSKAEELARLIRRSNKPFGGIQVVFVGDLYQLGPVQSFKSPSVKWCFESPMWSTLIDETIELEHVFRQSDAELIDILSKIRIGHINDNVIKFVKSLENSVFPDDGITPTLLVSTNDEAASENTQRTAAIQGHSVVSEALDCGIMKDDIDKHCITPKTIVLKRGSQVMLTQNINNHLVNGSRGVIVGFSLDSVLVKFTCGTTERIKKTIWTLEMLKQIADEHITHPKLPSEITAAKILADELKTYGIKADPNTATIITASRRQYPLVLAWAITIHKSQGQSIDRLSVNLSRTFAAGQVYTALSRATSQKTMKVTGFHPSRVKVDKKVHAFYTGFVNAIKQ